MTDVFVLRNQHNEYLNKSLEWISSGDSKTLYRTEHRDEVINQKVELTVKRPDLRIKVVAVELGNNGRILVDGEDCLPKLSSVAVDSGNGTDSETHENTAETAVSAVEEEPSEGSLFDSPKLETDAADAGLRATNQSEVDESPLSSEKETTGACS